MSPPAERRTVRRRRPWRRSALPRSRPALALGAVVAVMLLILLLLGLTRARPGRDVPLYDPTSTTTPVSRPPLQIPSVTAGATVPAAVTVAPATKPTSKPAATTTTRRRR